jgi:hypothetical protein
VTASSPSSSWRPVDTVALVLAISLGLLVVLIMVATTAQVFSASRPVVMLSENATQVLIAGVGGLTGLLGGYIGAHVAGRSRESAQRSPERPELPD